MIEAISGGNFDTPNSDLRGGGSTFLGRGGDRRPVTWWRYRRDGRGFGTQARSAGRRSEAGRHAHSGLHSGTGEGAAGHQPDLNGDSPSAGWRMMVTGRVCPATICSISLIGAGSVQKKPRTPPSKSGLTFAARRQAWFDAQPDLDPEKLIFIDETGASTKMARLRGRAKRGERCRAGPSPMAIGRPRPSPPACAWAA